MKQILKNTVILTLITLVAGMLLGLVYEITKEPIAISKENAKNEAYKQVMADAETFELYAHFHSDEATRALTDAGFVGCKIDEVVEGKVGSDIVGYVITATSSEGYGGDIQISVGILEDGTVNGIEFLSISETAGLGMKAKEPKFYHQYGGKQVDAFTVKKTGASSDSEIDALSGATITSNAVTNAVNASIEYYNYIGHDGGVENE